MLVMKARFGNRCIGGISNVDAPSLKSFRFTVRVTPFDFIVPGARDALSDPMLLKRDPRQQNLDI